MKVQYKNIISYLKIIFILFVFKYVFVRVIFVFILRCKFGEDKLNFNIMS